ncbi:hypothetical protein NQ095_05090 [Rossellomorea sp. SC111]|uniref:hypothetical protein n=1 Tax=Rossellomorea sp. SC111 TaxID=2968985 RepID=UPI00215A7B59|nr:hypothetical protein [Rossellomorea sp. SC111]MCR8847772.1 hypothetical protein [Rossellomorea sp. SC111]
MKKALSTIAIATGLFVSTSMTSLAAQGEESIAVKPSVMPENNEAVQVIDLETIGLSKDTLNRIAVSGDTQSTIQRAAGWQLLDPSHTVWPNADNGTWNTTNWDYISQSYTAVDGGNIGWSVYNLSGVWQGAKYLSPSLARIEVMVYEDDGVWSDDDFVTKFNVYPFNGDQQKMYTIPISGWADGTNAKAEVEFRYTYNFTATSEGIGNVWD